MIRILTLLVSLFTFGLVDLAEITYEIPVTDMLYFNDVEFYQTKNLFDKDTHTIVSGAIDSNGNNQVTNIRARTDFITINPLTTYILSLNTTFQARTVYYYNSSFTFISLLDIDGFSFTTPSNALYLKITVRQIFPLNDTIDSSELITINNTAQLELGSTSTSYSPYGLLSLNQIYDNPEYTNLNETQLNRLYELRENPELNITYEINTLDTQDLIILLASQTVWTIMIHLLYKYAYRPKKKSKRLGM
jgi:hypothetical protein